MQGVRAWMVLIPIDALALAAPALWTPTQWKASLSFAVLSVLFITGAERYRARLHASVLDEVPSLLGKMLMAAAVVATIIALRHDKDGVVVFLQNAALAAALLVAGRLVTTSMVVWSRRAGLTRHLTVLVGGGPLAAELAAKVSEHRRYGLAVVGFVDDGPEPIAEAIVPRLGRLRDLDRVVRETGADVLLLADGDYSEMDAHEAVRTENCIPCDLLVVPRMHHFHTQTGRADHIGSIPVMRIKTPNLNGPGRALKRSFDVTVAGAALLVMAPAMALIALAVRREGPGVIFRQPRVGRDGELFDVLKFRSLRPVDERESATNWSIAADDRVTPVGRLLRRTSLDEVPQLWNILRGDMTLVGPRPERPHFVEQFSAQYERYAHRHRVQSGLTGLAQVNGLRGDTSIADRARYDNYYIENWSLWLDVKIILRTVSEVVFARGR
ncbi:sugar transferase [Geodermatophilus pulveris]|uniref:sugar transferase n=1 Tax=Geodermatophilus pulveris TaxID=1564159 RepID=UPI001C529ACF|nr:sugar transferase [Geodermatophilus pulveris]